MTELVIVTHGRIGEALRAVAETILDRRVDVTIFPVEPGDDAEAATQRLAALLDGWSAASLPLLMTDLPGATPHNLAVAAARRALPGTPVVTGLNLPMLLRVLGHRRKPAAALAELALHGARAAIQTGACDAD